MWENIEVFLGQLRDVMILCVNGLSQGAPSNGTCLEHFTQEAAQSDAQTTSIGSFQYGGAEALP